MKSDWAKWCAADGAHLLDLVKGTAWVADMAACAQDAGWHAEGDVWTHTRMVFSEVERLAGFPDLPGRSQLLLRLTALFHDCGKPRTTIVDPETGRTRSPKHSLAGMQIARQVLREAGAPLGLREDLCALLRYHGRPAWLLEKPDPGREVIALSTVLENRLLHLFALADTRGRDTDETSRTEDDLEMWRLAAEEQGCYTCPWPWQSAEQRFWFHRDRLTDLRWNPPPAKGSRVTMMAGPSGAGKDTWLLTNRPELPVVSLDAIRGELDIDPADEQGTVIQAAREACRRHLRKAEPFAFNATNLSTDLRKRWIDLFADYDAHVSIVWLEPPPAVLRRQNRERQAAVPDRVLTKMLGMAQPPVLWEAHAVQLL